MLSTKPIAALAAFAFLSAATMPASAAGSSQARIDAAACDKPYFPARWQNDVDGASVVVGYLVGADGKVLDSKIVETSGFGYIDRASQRAGARCKFVPAGGSQAAAVWTKVKYSWVVD